MMDLLDLNIQYSSNQTSTGSVSRRGRMSGPGRPPKISAEQQLSDELNNVKKLQGARHRNVTTEDVDTILATNARLIEQLANPSRTNNSYEYVEKFAELQRNLVLISRLADQPK